MDAPDRPSLLDRGVDLAARAMDAVGLNGTRLRWRWNARRRDLGEAGMRAEVMIRSARGHYKMCPSCRSLVPRSAWTCPDCGQGLSRVRAPGLGRLFSNVLPGTTAATGIILLVNGAMFLVMLMAPYEVPGREAAPGLSRLLGFDGLTLIRYGSGFSPLTWQLGNWWRLVVPIFLHGGLLHFAMNSLALVQLGALVEEEYGTERFFFVYLACGVAGSVASQLPRVVNTVGASGAICGLLGLLFVHGVRRGGAYGAALRSSMARNTLFVLVMSFLPGIDWLCHVGGLACGFVLGWIVPFGPFRGRYTALVWEVLSFAAAAVVLASLWAMVRGGPEGVDVLLRHMRP